MKSKIIYFLFFFFPMLMMTAQESGIKGTVISSDDGMPLPGATVLISGTNTSTVTDFDGNFSFGNINADAVIVVSFIGFAPQSIPVKGQNTINITLKVDNNQLNEVVVT
ncbi:MAG TPA: carboxypeptidase-like regulatory domain-containing protein, partial [Flavobacterium sp.]|nr:carboxypeptidase-like regulatory domain-containing protein [Flavobacterium sp.]